MNRTFYTMLSGRSLANLASSLYLMTIVATVYTLTGSAALSGLVSFVRSIAILCSGLTLPYWYKKFGLSTVANLFLLVNFSLSATLTLSLPFLSETPTGPAFMVFIFVAMALIAYMEGCSSAAARALYVRIMPDDKRVQGNSLISTTGQMLSMFAWTVGGILVAQLGNVFVLQVSTALLLIGYIISSIVRDKQHAEPAAKANSSTWDGWRFLFTHPKLRIITWMDIVEGLTMGIWIGGITLVFVQEALLQDEAWWGYINTAYYMGTILGGILTMKLSQRINKQLIPTIIIGSFGVSIFVFAYAFVSNPYVALTLVLIMGPFYQLRDIAQSTYVQQHTPLDDQPNVFAAQHTISFIAFGLSVLIAGTLADLFGPRVVYILGGTLYFLSAASAFVLRRSQQQSDIS
ncbi:MFS transporter [Paenibacillus sp. 481]|uniref:MFS transporter n=1 Tax=Paenibacillus sp. 481 TaxID=2835869 RepID=UPI001E3E3849|nr:MFS transporter [Paenibacillus sp. 481]UHA73974.1 MFS transporter [Paenibacillus sp. 481]